MEDHAAGHLCHAFDPPHTLSRSVRGAEILTPRRSWHCIADGPGPAEGLPPWGEAPSAAADLHPMRGQLTGEVVQGRARWKLLKRRGFRP
jgi:hypothetical protein